MRPERVDAGFAGDYVRVDIEVWPDLGAYEVIRQAGAAAIVAVTEDGDVLLVRQFRPPIADQLLEIPAGLLDIEGEDAMTCAIRELGEETGHEATDVGFLGGVYVSPGSSDHYVHLFAARAASLPSGTPEAGIEVVRRPFGVMVAAARAGRVRDAKTALGLLLAEPRFAAG